MDVSIIIVNYNTKALLANCLHSVYENTRDLSFEIIVVDNASSDGSQEYITVLFQNVKWINAGENLGFGRANNLGSGYASGKYLFFLNSDTILKNNAVKIFHDYAEQNPGIGALGCMMSGIDGKQCSSYGFFPGIKNEIRYLTRKMFGLHEEFTAKEKKVDYISGADLFMRKNMFLDFGGFDSEIFMYYEETDLQYRISLKGLPRVLISGAEIIHLEGGSFENRGLSPGRFMMAQKSYNHYIRKHFKGFYYYFYRVSLCFLRLSIFITTNWPLKEKIKAYKLVISGK